VIPVSYPVQEPTRWAGAEIPDLSELRAQTVTSIQFRVDEPVYQMIGEQMRDRGLRYYHYVCYSCLAASGDKEHCFTTSWASRNNMSKGPTNQQQTQMKQHAEDHSIIWSWARQQDR